MPKALAALATLLILLTACAPRHEAVGKRLFQDYCTSCHGADAHGDIGPDLTLIAQRNGGTFPVTHVISTIDGYTRIREGNATMPEFGIELQAGPLILYDTGDGRPTPTPERLVALAEYLASIQE